MADTRPAALSQKEPFAGFKVGNMQMEKEIAKQPVHWASVCRKTGCAQVLMRLGRICPPKRPLQDPHGAPSQAAIITFKFTSIPEGGAHVSLFPLSSGSNTSALLTNGGRQRLPPPTSPLSDPMIYATPGAAPCTCTLAVCT